MPNEAPYLVKGASPEAPTIYTDVLLHIKISQMISHSLNAPAKKSERLDPLTVAAQARAFQEQYVDTLHPAFRLGNPDTRWDKDIPTLPMKRELLFCHIYGIMESMHRGFIGLGPENGSEPQTRRDRSEDSVKRKCAERHRETLAESCINILHTVSRLHKMMGGGTQRYFVVSGGVIEGAAVLGMCLISDLAGMRNNQDPNEPHVFVFNTDLQQRSYTAFVDGLALLHVLAENNSTAQKGLKLLGNLHRMLQMEDRSRILGRPPFNNEIPCPEQLPLKTEPAVLDHVGLASQFYVQGPPPYVTGPGYPTVDSMMLGDLESFSNGDFSWFFEDAPGGIYVDPLMNLGNAF